MKKSYLDAYYPDGMSAEDRLFRDGNRMTKTPLRTWLNTLLIGVVVSVLGFILMVSDSDASGFGVIAFGIGDLVLLVGIWGISMYYSGLRALERAELLYNTRLAGREDPEEEPKPFWKRETETKTWKCSCGRTHPEYSYLCECGKSKTEAQK